jgi:hypothetical protein
MVVFGLDDAVILKERTAKLHLFSIPRKGQCNFFVKAPEPVEGPFLGCVVSTGSTT